MCDCRSCHSAQAFALNGPQLVCVVKAACEHLPPILEGQDLINSVSMGGEGVRPSPRVHVKPKGIIPSDIPACIHHADKSQAVDCELRDCKLVCICCSKLGQSGCNCMHTHLLKQQVMYAADVCSKSIYGPHSCQCTNLTATGSWTLVPSLSLPSGSLTAWTPSWSAPM